MHRRLIASIAGAGIMALLVGSALASDTKATDTKKKPDATLKLSEGSMALGVGWSWGHGVLTYQGKTHKCKVEGLTVGEVGVTKAEASGKVYNLKKLADFDGLYSAGGAGATAGKGAGTAALVNEKGVSITLTSETKGASLKIAVEGLKLKLED
jgi:hypothetical protein